MGDEALDRLAALAGIEDGWTDFFGQYRATSSATKRAFLTAMGFRVETAGEIAASLEDFEARPWRRWLPRVTVGSEAAGPPVLDLALPDHRAGELLRWTVLEENGALHRGEVRPRELPVAAERDLDGERHRRYAFALPGTPLPGIHSLRLTADDGAEAMATLIVAPSRAHLPAALEGSGRLWGYATQLYALRSDRNWGVGDFSDLADLARLAGRQGAAALGINPLHALFASRPDRFSPYSPSSRLFLNVAYIDVEAVPDFAESAEARRLFASPGFQAELAAARAAERVDYPAVARLKRGILEGCWASFRARHLDDPPSGRGQAFRQFQRAGGRSAERFAVFEALQEFFLKGDPDKGYWRHWPAEYQQPDGPAVTAFAQANRERVEFHWYLQWLADRQLFDAQAACCEAGMQVGVYRDLGVGIAGDGAEAWANQSLLCLGVSVGAPPDPLNLAGQDWGLVPFNPVALQEAAYLPFLAVLEANMAHAGAMRLDHAMSLQRLYWVPQGAKADQGAYVRYPVEDMFALLALASRRKGCLVIGEDLGTVPEGFRDRMAGKGILGYRLMVFEKAGGRFKPPEAFPATALIGFGTHDLPSLAGWWQGMDAEERQRLGLYPDPAMGLREFEQRAEDRRLMVEALAAAGLLAKDFSAGAGIDADGAAKLASAIYAYMSRTPCKLLMVQFEDVLGLALQMNLPGTTDQHPNWRSRYPLNVAAMLADGRLSAVARWLVAERPMPHWPAGG